MRIRWIALCFLMLPVLVSCATSVTFDVTHPPLADLRGANSITVIPFERDCDRRFEYLSAYVTSALVSGIKNNMIRGNISFVEPAILADVSEKNYGQYVDVFITGKIIDITQTISNRSASRNVRDEIITIDVVTLSVMVNIEYAYINARDGKVLGNFIKSEEFTQTANLGRNRYGSGNWNRAEYGLHPEWHDPGQWNQNRRRRGHLADNALRRGSWGETLAKSAINKFSFTMSQELASWTTTEERSLRRRTGNEPMLDEARRLINMGRYDQALKIYQEIYTHNDSVYLGYNTAVLLAANEQFMESLALLEHMHRALLTSGQSTPRFIKREIERMAEFVNGLEILAEYRTGGNAAASLIPLIKDEPVNARAISGTINLNIATVYALSEAIAFVEDTSVWSKMVASANASTFEGRWSMSIPVTAPSLLWFVVIDSRSNMYITQTALGASGTIVLDTAKMTRLE
ncbi:MAG: hypothetical protein FWD36_05330 [Treponema sp.]|nr:hypothetical protein [Treponema sp.]